MKREAWKGSLNDPCLNKRFDQTVMHPRSTSYDGLVWLYAVVQLTTHCMIFIGAVLLERWC